MSAQACVPEVIAHSEVSRRMQCVKHKIHSHSDGTQSFCKRIFPLIFVISQFAMAFLPQPTQAPVSHSETEWFFHFMMFSWLYRFMFSFCLTFMSRFRLLQRNQRQMIRCQIVNRRRFRWRRRRPHQNYQFLCTLGRLWILFAVLQIRPFDDIRSDDVQVQLHLFARMHRVSKGVCAATQSSGKIWFPSRILLNKLAHAVYGNMFHSNAGRAGKGSGKGKQGKPQPSVDPEENFYEDIRSSLPQAAVERMQPKLFSEDWSVPVRSSHELSSQPGIAVMPRALVPHALRQVGYTRNAVAILTTQSAVQMNLRGYPCETVYCRFQVLTEDGEYKEAQVQRHLIQLGFADRVSMTPLGDRIDMPQTMLKGVIKLPSCFGWTSETIRGSTISQVLSQHLDLHTVEGIQSRENGSATLMIHQTAIEAFLALSGRDSVFTKIHASDESKYPTFLLWLPEDISLQAALDMTSKDTLGVVAKNSKLTPRFAMRFQDETKLASFAKLHNLSDTSKCGRWRVDGLAPHVGSAGAIGLLQSKGWDINDFLYFGSHHCVFTSNNCGPTSPLHYNSGGSSVQHIRFKAVNAAARKMQEDEAKKSRPAASKAAPKALSSDGRTAFLKNLAPKVNSVDLTVASPRQRRTDEKRPLAAHSGETPPGTKPRDG